MPAITTTNLTKKFGELVAVDSATLSVGEGEIFGLLGPNGAGKTTLISMLVTMKQPTSGLAIVNGFNVVKNQDEVRNSIGIVFQDPSLDEELTAFENLELHAAMYGIPGKERRKRIVEVMETVELSDRLNDLVKTYSGGMKRRLEIARSFLHRPKILFLDEPTIGLDPQTRKRVWEFVKKLRDEHGVTIILTTHYLEEADSLCDRIAIIDHGKIIALDTAGNLKNSLGGDVIAIQTEKPVELAAALKNLAWVKAVDPRATEVALRVEEGEKKIPQITAVAREKNIELDSIALHKPTLDDVFTHFTGRAIREEHADARDSMRIHRRAWGRGR